MPIKNFLPFVCLFLLLGLPLAMGEIVINEFTGNNSTVLADEDGDFEDWLELFNAGQTAVDLGGYGLTDNPADPFQWVLPSVVLEPGQHLLIWTSNKDRAPAQGERRTGIVREVFTGIPGTGVAELLAHPSFPDQPDSRNLVTDFFEAPRDIDDHYGQRMHGFLRAPATGSYTFWIASDDGGRLYLNPTIDTELDYDDPIAYVADNQWTSWRQWNKYSSQQSAPISLEEGQLYYIAALMKEHGGGDHLSVRWSLPDGTMEEPIPAHHIFTAPLQLHTNFSISKAGNPLQLVAPDGSVVDAIGPVQLPPDVSYGRVTDGAGEWGFFDQPTPGKSNNTATSYAGILDPPAFSHVSGFYPDTFSLTLETEDPDSNIVYTMDGSEPDAGNLAGTTYDYKNQYPGGDFFQRTYQSFSYEEPLPISAREVPFSGIPSINTESSSGSVSWTTEGDEIVQYSTANDPRLMFGDINWTDYELTLQARKISGAEGFLILFRADGDHFYQLNLGGWGNTEHAIQKGDGQGGSPRYAGLRLTNRSIQSDVWYDIRIRVEGQRFQCWLNNELLFDHVDSSSPNLHGQVGISTWGTRARFRDIEVRSLESTGDTLLFSGLPTRTIKSTVIRARAHKEGYLPSHAVSHTYFVDPDIQAQITLPVISIATDEPNLFGYHHGIYVAGINYDQAGVAHFLFKGQLWERPAHVTFLEPDGQIGFSQMAGIRIHGGWTRNLPQKSMRLYARGSLYDEPRFEHQVHPDLPYTSFNRLLLRNSGNDNGQTMFRDAMMQRLVKHRRLDTQAYRPASLYINGEYWGFLNIRDRYDRHYLARTHGVDPDRVDILEFRPSSPHAVKEGGDAHYVETLNYISAHGLAEPTHYDHIRTRIDIENFLEYHVSQIYFNNTDWPNNNHDFWRAQTASFDPAAPYGHDGRWRWLLFDTDFGFGHNQHYSYNMLDAVTQTSNDWWRGSASTFLLRSLLENDQFKIDFVNRFADLLNTAFQPDRVTDVINEMQAVIAPEMEAHIQRWGRPTSWSSHVNTMRQFGNNRPGHIRSHIRSKFSLNEHNLTLNVPNAAEGHIRVNTIDLLDSTPGIGPSPYPWTGTYFNVPIQITAIPAPGFRFSHWQELAGSPEAESQALTLTLHNNQQLTAVFEPAAGASSLLHYWHFNDLAEGVVSQVPADRSVPGAASITYTGTGAGFMDDTEGSDLNTRLDEPAGKGLRVRNPSDERTLLITLPTTGYESIHLSYAAHRTNNGAQGQLLEYQTSENGDWIPFGEPLTITTEYELFTFDFSAVPEANDNPDFRVRIRFGGTNASGTAGNNRFDNITLDGVPLVGTVPPPTVSAPIDFQELVENTATTIDLGAHFSSPSSEPLSFSASADKSQLVDIEIVGSDLILSPLYRGETVITVWGDDGSNPPAQTSFRLLIYPQPHLLQNGAFLFTAWDSDHPENTFPDRMLFLQSGVTDPELDAALEHAYFIPSDDYHLEDSAGFPYNNTRRTRLTGLGEDGISFINTGRDRDLGGALLALDTTGQESVFISWTGGTLESNSRVYHIRLQYRTAIDQPFADLLDEHSNPVEYVRTTLPGNSLRLGPVALPPAALDQSNLQLLWRYYHTGEQIDELNGARDELRLDDIVVATDNAISTYQQWRAETFTDPGALSDPADDPLGQGITNLMRYSFDIPLDETGRERLPRLAVESGDLFLVFPYRNAATDIAYIVESSTDLTAWSEPLFDSRVGPIETDPNGNLRIEISPDGPNPTQFFRVRILLD